MSNSEISFLHEDITYVEFKSVERDDLLNFLKKRAAKLEQYPDTGYSSLVQQALSPEYHETEFLSIKQWVELTREKQLVHLLISDIADQHGSLSRVDRTRTYLTQLIDVNLCGAANGKHRLEDQAIFLDEAMSAITALTLINPNLATVYNNMHRSVIKEIVEKKEFPLY